MNSKFIVGHKKSLLRHSDLMRKGNIFIFALTPLKIYTRKECYLLNSLKTKKMIFGLPYLKHSVMKKGWYL